MPKKAAAKRRQALRGQVLLPHQKLLDPVKALRQNRCDLVKALHQRSLGAVMVLRQSQPQNLIS